MIAMSEIKVERIDKEKLKNMGVFDWPTWKKGPSTFDWHYDKQETCYILEGQVRVEPKYGPAVDVGPGDLVTFPKGLDCVWKIKKEIRKHYIFK
jgi:uncharacterized cupin superfamily protein